MAEYKAIRGLTIRTIAGDASPLITGDIWYNSSAKAIKGAKIAAGAWSTGGDLNTARSGAGGAGAAPSSGALIFGGSTNVCETYDGSSWTELADLSTARNWASGFGASATAAVCAGGEPVSVNAEKWNGASWTEVNNLNTGRHVAAGTGPSTAGQIAGGKIGENFQVIVEQYDGTNWSETGDLNTARGLLGHTGVTTAALAFGGASPYTANSESFDGSSWTEGNNLNVAKAYLQVGFGIQTASLAVGGNTGAGNLVATTEEYDGTSWTEVGDLPTAISSQAGGGTTSAGVAAGGQLPSVSDATYEWSAAIAAVTFTSS